MKFDLSTTQVGFAVRPAETIRKLSGLLAAGVPANQAYAHFQAEFDQFSSEAQEQFQQTWVLAQNLGGAPTHALNRLAEVLDFQAAQLVQIQLAYAAPKATARLVMGLPFFALILGQLLGLNPIGAITDSPIGFISFALGLILLVLGQLWVQNLLEKAKPTHHDPGQFLDAVAIGLAAGLDPTRAEIEARNSLISSTSPESESAAALLERQVAEQKLRECQQLALTTGSSIRHLVADAAQGLREAQRFSQSQQINRLQIRLMLPLGLSTLPAFVLLAVAPMALGMLAQ